MLTGTNRLSRRVLAVVRLRTPRCFQPVCNVCDDSRKDLQQARVVYLLCNCCCLLAWHTLSFTV